MQSSTQVIQINGHDLSVRLIVGEVLHADRRFETHIEGSGGGGSVGPTGGYIHGPTVTSSTSEHQKVFVRTDAGKEESFDFQNWKFGVRPGSRIALVTCVDEGASVQWVLATRNLDTGEEMWRDIREWATRRRLLVGKMRIWPSALFALVLGGYFALVNPFSRRAPTLSGFDSSDFWLASGMLFAFAFVLEWIMAIVLRVSDGEPKRVGDLLQEYLRSGKLPN